VPIHSRKKISALPYLTAVCCETLRRNPILPRSAGGLRQPLEIRGYTLAGRGWPSRPWLARSHGRAGVRENPGCSRPERFLERQYSAVIRVRTLWRRDASLALAEPLPCTKCRLFSPRFSRGSDSAWKARSQLRPRRRNFPFGPLDAVKLVVEGRRQPGLNPS